MRSATAGGSPGRAAKVTHWWVEPGTGHTVDNPPAAQRSSEVCGQRDPGAAHGSWPERAGDPGKEHFVLALAGDQAATALDDDNDRPPVRRHPDPRPKQLPGSLQPIRRQRQRASAPSSSRGRTPRRGAATHHEQHRDHARHRKRGGQMAWAHVHQTQRSADRFRPPRGLKPPTATSSVIEAWPPIRQGATSRSHPSAGWRHARMRA
jgi:hypothetical protein